MSYESLEIKSSGKFLKVESGQPHDIRILNESPASRTVHGFGPDERECGGTHCQRCAEGRKDDEPKQRFKTNVFDYQSRKVLIWDFGIGIAKQLRSIAQTLGEEGKKIIDVDLKIDATGSNKTKKYSVTPRMTSKQLPDGLMLHKIEAEVPF